MKLQFNKLAALVAATLFGGLAHASSNNTNPRIENICRQISARPDLASQLLTMSKFELEYALQQRLTNGEFVSIHQLLKDLASANAPAEYVEPHEMVLASQEISGGR